MSPAAVLHVVHAGVLAVPAVAIAVVLVRSRPPSRAVERLRADARAGTLVAAAERRATHLLLREERLRPAAVVTVAATLTAGVVHGAVCPEHFREAWRLGVFFLLASLAQFALAAATAAGARGPLARAAVIVNAGCVVLWLATRTVGLPLGLAPPEPVGPWDLLATAAELVAVLAALRLCARPALRARPRAVVG